MPVGLEIKNDFGSVLIDSEHPTLVHVATYTEADTLPGGLGRRLPITDATDQTLIAYQGSIPTTVSYVNRITASHREYWFPDLSSSVACKFYRFELVRDLGSTYGLVLRDSAGRVTFDALQRPGRVMAALTSSANIIVPTGRSYALAFAQSYYSLTYERYPIDPDNPSAGDNLIGHYLQTRGRAFGNEVAYASAQNIGDLADTVPVGTPTPPNIQRGSALGLVLDVTGY